jgi:hypothetical protein
MFWASQAPIHSALLKGTNHRSGGLEPALRHHTGNGEAALDFDTAPFLRGHVIRDEEPAPASPAHISILAALIQELNEVRQILAFTEDFAIKRGAQFSELNRLQPYLAASYLSNRYR